MLLIFDVEEEGRPIMAKSGGRITIRVEYLANDELVPRQQVDALTVPITDRKGFTG